MAYKFSKGSSIVIWFSNWRIASWLFRILTSQKGRRLRRRWAHHPGWRGGRGDTSGEDSSSGWSGCEDGWCRVLAWGGGSGSASGAWRGSIVRVAAVWVALCVMEVERVGGVVGTGLGEARVGWYGMTRVWKRACVAVCCRVLCCSMLQCVLLQCVSVSCSMMRLKESGSRHT